VCTTPFLRCGLNNNVHEDGAPLGRSGIPIQNRDNECVRQINRPSCEIRFRQVLQRDACACGLVRETGTIVCRIRARTSRCPTIHFWPYLIIRSTRRIVIDGLQRPCPLSRKNKISGHRARERDRQLS
jgi:hypothetical protein